MTTSEEDTENIGILGVDSSLQPFKDHFQYRIKKYVDQKNLLEKHEGGLEEFATGHFHFSIIINATRFWICFLCSDTKGHFNDEIAWSSAFRS